MTVQSNHHDVRATEQALAALRESSVLNPKDWELAIISALAGLGRKALPQLPEHIHAALDAGARQQEIVDGLATISQGTGTPTAVNSIAIADRVFKERVANGKASEQELVWNDADQPGGTVAERAQRAKGTIAEVYPAGPTDDTYSAVAERAPHFWRDASTVFYNDLFLHPGIELKYRELFVLSNLIATNVAPLQTKWHTHGALNNGWTRQDVLEIIAQLAPYVGVPNALAAARLAREVFGDRDSRGTAKPHETTTREVEPGAFAAVTHSAQRAISVHTGQDHLRGDSWENAAAIAPRLHDLAVTAVFDTGTGLDQRTHQLTVTALLVAEAADADQLAVHVEAARRAGASSAELAAVVRLAASVAGNSGAATAETVINASGTIN